MAENPTPREIEEAYVRYVALVNTMAEHAAHIANARRALYLAYISEGFTEDQALILCQKLTLE